MGLAPGRLATRRQIGAVSFALALVLVALLALAPRVMAGELIYWSNYKAKPATIAFANIDGSGGGALNLTGINLKSPEGIAYDSQTGRLYIADSGASSEGNKGAIDYVNVDGSGAGVLSTPGIEVSEPFGVAIDPSTRLIYWVNASGAPGKAGIGFAKLDGSGGGTLNTSGATIDNPYRLAIDPLVGKVFFGNQKSHLIGYANLNNTGGGGTLDVTGAPTGSNFYGFAVDEAAGRLYWLNSTAGKEHLSYASVNGGAGGELSLLGATFKTPYGLAIDPTLGRIYWPNYGQSALRANGFGFTGLAGAGPGGITPQTAPFNGPEDPVIVKSPTGTAPPTLTRSKGSRAKLRCATGTWAADFPGSFTYRAPHTFSYQWKLKGKLLAGAKAATLDVKKTGGYSCVVTAANQAGSAAQASLAIQIKPAKFKLSPRPAVVRVKAGAQGILKVKAANVGDLKSKTVHLCLEVPKQAGNAVIAPRCKRLAVAGGHKPVSALALKTTSQASGTYDLKVVVHGAPGKSAKVKLQIVR